MPKVVPNFFDTISKLLPENLRKGRRSDGSCSTIMTRPDHPSATSHHHMSDRRPRTFRLLERLTTDHTSCTERETISPSKSALRGKLTADGQGYRILKSGGGSYLQNPRWPERHQNPLNRRRIACNFLPYSGYELSYKNNFMMHEEEMALEPPTR